MPKFIQVLVLDKCVESQSKFIVKRGKLSVHFGPQLFYWSFTKGFLLACWNLPLDKLEQYNLIKRINNLFQNELEDDYNGLSTF